jgi:hypothetical protein
MSEFLDRVRHSTATTGTGTSVTLASTAYNNAFLTVAEAGGVDGRKYSYVIEDGTDFEIQDDQTWSSAGNTFTRGTPKISKIAGTAGTTKMNLSGSASVRLIASAKTLTDLFTNAKKQAIIFG